MDGTFRDTAVGLVWADPQASASYLAAGKPLAPEQVLAIALAESLAEKERLRREREQLEGRLKANARNDELNDLKIQRQREALRIYEETGKLPLDLEPQCDAAIRNELAKDRKAITAQVEHEADALRQRGEQDGWQFVSKKIDGERLLVTLAKPIKDIAPELQPLRRYHIQRRIRRAFDQLKAPGLPRPQIARRAVEVFMLNLRPAQVALLPASTGPPH